MNSQYVGKINERININNAKCIMKYHDTSVNASGSLYRIHFIDENENVFVYNTHSSDASKQFIVGETYNLRGSVKLHIPADKGIKRTSLKVVKIRS